MCDESGEGYREEDGLYSFNGLEWFEIPGCEYCPACNAPTEEKVRAIEQNIPAEIDYVCTKCGASVAYWAYGYFQY